MLILLSKHQKTIAWFLIISVYVNLILLPGSIQASPPTRMNANETLNAYSWKEYFSKPADRYNNASPNLSAKANVLGTSGIRKSSSPDSVKSVFTTGPTQPEMQSFRSVKNSNMVDLFTGDFSYNIPLLDVGGYPVNLSYRNGISMDQEASWVGLGWNINPGTITRNMRGLPDDFNGTADSITKVLSIKENRTIGVTAGMGDELAGFPLLKASANLGVFHNNYKGIGLEYGLNASLNSANSAKGRLSGGLSITNNTQEGFTITPSLSLTTEQISNDQGGMAGVFSIGVPYNSRFGIRNLQMSTGVRHYDNDKANQVLSENSFSSFISFARPSFTPSIQLPYTSRQISFTAKTGTLKKVFDGNLFISGYVSSQRIDKKDTLLSLPAFGYLNYQNAKNYSNALLDFNQVKDLPYRERPSMPHIAIPNYTYDAFSITGEGTGGMFRAYRGDIGFVHDPLMKTKDESGRLGLDFGGGDIVHAGVDLNINRSVTQTGEWIEKNPLRSIIGFHNDSADFQAAYFRNPGEKSINSKEFYEAIGSDDLVTVNLFQASTGSAAIQTTNYLTTYKNKRETGKQLLTAGNSYRRQRDKRTQVISYLSASEAQVAGLSKYIDNYKVNQFTLSPCLQIETDLENGSGLIGQYFMNESLSGTPVKVRLDSEVNIPLNNSQALPSQMTRTEFFSVRWFGRIKAPVSGTYTFYTQSDDGVRVWLNDSCLINNWTRHPSTENSFSVNLLKGEFYKLKIEFMNVTEDFQMLFRWTYPGQQEKILVPTSYLYGPQTDEIAFPNLTYERRVNDFRKSNHISEVSVLNNDGRRYIYGIPVYNLKQREVSFSVNASDANKSTGQVKYIHGIDNSTNNSKGKDNYFSSEEVPAYAHSFLLTGILSADYIDITGNGISDDDPGDAVKFNYSKISGIKNPFKWRAPHIKDSITYNEGLKTDLTDDKGNYVYGEKELWYLHSIESKTMIATFTVENRKDLLAVSENGAKENPNAAKRLKEINLYTKAEFLKNPFNPRPIKTVHFEYSYDLCRGVNLDEILSSDTGKLTLKRVWFTYNGNKKGEQNPYTFYYKNNKPYQQKAYDRWGNFKDPKDNPSFTEFDVLGNDEYPYSLQDSIKAAENAAVWALDSIFLPSGGSIKVDYESDDYAYVQNKRAMQMVKVLGFGPSATGAFSNRLFNGHAEHLYVYISLSQAVANTKHLYNLYLDDIQKLYFKLFVKMPSSVGGGHEYVSGFADIDPGNGYGLIDNNTAWIKVKGISLKGDGEGDYSPFVKSAIQYLRLNLPAQAYPNSEVGDNLSADNAVKLLLSLSDNVKNAFTSFDVTARNMPWVNEVDLNRSYIRINNPEYKKYGGGHRVKRISIYDNWEKMTNQRTAVYGQEYTYTTKKEVNGKVMEISSGVASYEPAIGGEENPFRQPIEYIEKSSLLGPVSLGYSEEPLGESFFPSASVGYSNVRVRTINYKNRKSANGYEETRFFTTYDFPTYTDRTVIDNNTKKRYRPAISNFLRINARHHVVLSQGFKIELNDMNGKLRSKASYPETDPNNFVTYTENVYKVEDANADHKRLDNRVHVINPDGKIDTTAIIGKDVELMIGFREQLSVSAGYNMEVNADMFSVPVPGFFVLPSLFNFYQREENLYRSAAAVKVIQRYGILDSVIHIEKGSKVSTRDILYDSETGDVLLTKTQNEFNDPVFNFTYPSHWAYKGMGLAYSNIDVFFDSVNIKDGRVVKGLSQQEMELFASGDEIFVAGKLQITNQPECDLPFSTFPSFTKIWAIDSSVLNNGPRTIFFIDKEGKPYNGFDISMRVIRSGKRNILYSVGSVSTLKNPIIKNAENRDSLILNTQSNVIAAQSQEFRQLWNIEDIKANKVDTVFHQEPCPEGYSYSPQLKGCIKDTAVVISNLDTICLVPSPYIEYSSCGTYIYSSFDITNSYFQRSRIDPTNAFWRNIEGSYSCNYTPVESKNNSVMSMAFYESFQYTDSTGDNSLNGFSTNLVNDPPPRNGPLNRSGVWVCNNTQTGIYNGVTIPFSVPSTGFYYIGMGADNFIRVTIDGQLFKEDTGYASQENFRIWHVYPKYLTAGSHTLKVEGMDMGDMKTFGLEIYNNTESELKNATGYNNLNLILSTKDLNGAVYPASYSCPIGYTLDKNDTGSFVCRSYIPVLSDTITSETCVSIVTDTAFNPYVVGALGNWRLNKTYAYYSPRMQSDPTALSNIRIDGAFLDFNPFWKLESRLFKPQYDSTRWVWNSEITLFNRKGFEIENRDPLGRYNSGLYGYNLSMPVAVIQNSPFHESAFEGFEDYDYVTRICDTVCPSERHIDYTIFKSKLNNSTSHSGKTSLRLSGQDDKVALSIPLADTIYNGDRATLDFSTAANVCAPETPVLKEIKTSEKVLSPSFSPAKGQRMVLSAWVREEQQCNCTSFINNRIVIVFSGGSNQSYIFKPSGSIIEGWQRYESFFDVPLNDTLLTVSLEATGSTPVYFDDLRIHPFNANMKSFVYDPGNLRLLAELDENNYATFYEYDDEGTLIRLKKETQRGIKTIRETRSALVKDIQ